ncbi:MerR family transcriptional regulator [Williamsia sp. CHRR-6]|uniref:MerR family transcriptional regulator n=1 Tax=Williamsia sp. CHRR-6 TaxID=2835871 RepID=UPI001BD9A887|nr:MerR family transcriptional regulator [Williamsia sp. CHRR-6]MBT0566301.1 MerR family transcriptional regulator [Williamsia sp. CHRR-6]
MTEYRIDDLARAAGTTTRNVRGYQDRGLLPRPAKRGRIAIYTDIHLTRLRLINDLLKRGFTARHIADFIKGMQRGDDLAKVLGIEEILSEPWAKNSRERVTAETLKSVLNSIDPKDFEAMARLGLIRRDGDGYRVLDRDTVYGMGRLVELGMSLRSMLEVFGELDSQLDAATSTLITAARKEFESRRGEGWVPDSEEESEWVAVLLTEMRSVATKAAHNALNRSLDRTLQVNLKDYLADAGSTDDEVEETA